MKLDYMAPPDDLAAYISAFYLFEAELHEMSDVERADIAQFRVVLDGTATVTFADGRISDFARASLFGPRMAASKITARGPRMRMFGCGLLPAGWALSVRHPAHEWANQVIAADDAITKIFPNLLTDLAACTTIEAMVDVASTCCRIHYAGVDRQPQSFIGIVDEWLTSSLVPVIAELEAATGLSQRQIERLAKHY